MRLQQELTLTSLTDQPVVFSLGGFDGVHRGHQHLLAMGRQIADRKSALLSVLTFSTQPRHFLYPYEPFFYLTSQDHKRRLLEKVGVDLLIEIPFSNELRSVSAEQFLTTLYRMIPIDTWVAGHDLHFGRNCEGTCAFLEQSSEKTGLKTAFVERIVAHGEQISSTRIRSLVTAGDLSQAETLLGRPYSFCIPASSPLRFHIDTAACCLPPDGVYVAKVQQDNGRFSFDAFVHVFRDGSAPRACEVIVSKDALSSVAMGRSGVEFLEVIILHPVAE